MKNSTSHRQHQHGTKSSPRGSSPAGDPAPVSPWELYRRLGRTHAPACVGETPEHFALNRDWMINELEILAIDCDRAWSYIARPGSNVMLGMTQVARSMAKHSMILAFLRDEPPADQAPSDRFDQSNWWDAWKQESGS